MAQGFLTGKGAIVTGGTRGIGRAIARALAMEGCGVAICGRDGNSAQTAVNELITETGSHITGLGADVRDREAVAKLFSTASGAFGGIDIVVNNAGIGVFAPVADLRAEDWNRVIETNLTGVFHCCQEALACFKKRGGGYLIQIGSLAGKNPFAGGAVYNASKFALNGFSEALMLDHRHDNVRVSTILPGSVDTDFTPRTGNTKSEWKIAPEDIADIVIGLLRMPARTMISHVEVRPSRPQKR
ncbi:MAG: SDR family oxidoreductase [Acidobacteria bacterium]|nr:SDR family oxidoreductase [Acidobacteriota bacterium]